MFVRLLLLFTVVPAIELMLLIQLGKWMGTLETVALIVITGTVGAALAKREGLGVLTQLQADTAKGIPPADRLVEGLMVLIGGALLITPGVLTDLFGFLLIAPPSRRFFAPRIKQAVLSRVTIRGVGVGAPPPEGAAPRGSATAGGRRHVGGAPTTAPDRGDAKGFDHPVQES